MPHFILEGTYRENQGSWVTFLCEWGQEEHTRSSDKKERKGRLDTWPTDPEWKGPLDRLPPYCKAGFGRIWPGQVVLLQAWGLLRHPAEGQGCTRTSGNPSWYCRAQSVS